MSPNFLIAEVQMATIARVTKNMYNVYKFIYMYMKLLRKVQGGARNAQVEQLYFELESLVCNTNKPNCLKIAKNQLVLAYLIFCQEGCHAAQTF